MSDDDTDFVKRNNPLLYGAIKLVMNELRPIIYAAIAYIMSHNSEKKDVQQVWQHSGHWVNEIQQVERTEQYESNK